MHSSRNVAARLTRLPTKQFKLVHTPNLSAYSQSASARNDATVAEPIPQPPPPGLSENSSTTVNTQSHISQGLGIDNGIWCIFGDVPPPRTASGPRLPPQAVKAYNESEIGKLDKTARRKLRKLRQKQEAERIRQLEAERAEELRTRNSLFKDKSFAEAVAMAQRRKGISTVISAITEKAAEQAESEGSRSKVKPVTPSPKASKAAVKKAREKARRKSRPSLSKSSPKVSHQAPESTSPSELSGTASPPAGELKELRTKKRTDAWQGLQSRENTVSTEESGGIKEGGEDEDGLPLRERYGDENWFSSGWGEDALAPPTIPSSHPAATADSLLSFSPEPSHSTSTPRFRHPLRSSLGPYLDRDFHHTERTSAALEKREHEGRPSLPLSYQRRVEGFVTAEEAQNMQIKDLDPPTEQRPIARLAHGLDRVLFNPGVYWLQDPRSRVFNFTPWLQDVPKVSDFDFDRVHGFVKSSQDNDLFTLAKQEKCYLTGSTSSLTGMLSHIYIMLSREKLVDTSTLSIAFQNLQRNFTPGQKLPVSVVLRHQDGVWSTDSNPADPGASEKNVLTWMGTMLEKFLTIEENEFRTLLKDAPKPEMVDDGKKEAYRYARFGNYIMRSQLDCYDPRLPGTGVFDIKTRAALPIRVDLMNWEENSGYLIRSLQGNLESFEREYYDLIRSAFLKYSFQARIGNMDGVFVTYHNTARIFGFQYVPLEEMDERLYGNKRAGQTIFERCMTLLEIINTEIVRHFPEQSVATLWDSYPDKAMLRVWAEAYDKPKDGSPPKIIELEVHAINYLGSESVKGWAVAGAIPETDWTVHYKLFVSSHSPDIIRARRQAVLDRQLHYWALPSGVSPENASEYWRSINYSGKSTSASSRAPPFKSVDKRLEALRELARKGRIESEREAAERAGKRLIVWGMPDLIDEVPETVVEAVMETGAEDMDGVEAQAAAELETEGEIAVAAEAEAMEAEAEAAEVGAVEAEAEAAAEAGVVEAQTLEAKAAEAAVTEAAVVEAKAAETEAAITAIPLDEEVLETADIVQEVSTGRNMQGTPTIDVSDRELSSIMLQDTDTAPPAKPVSALDFNANVEPASPPGQQSVSAMDDPAESAPEPALPKTNATIIARKSSKRAAAKANVLSRENSILRIVDELVAKDRQQQQKRSGQDDKEEDRQDGTQDSSGESEDGKP